MTAVQVHINQDVSALSADYGPPFHADYKGGANA